MPIPIIRTAREARAPYDRRQAVKGPEEAAEAARAVIGNPDREHFAVLHLCRKNRVISAEIAHIGTGAAVMVGAREVFRAAIAQGAAAIVVAHNHPSGDPTPSPEDIELTRKLIEAGRLLGIQLLDHVVIGDHDAARPYVAIRDAHPGLAWE